jgi:subtilisin family serine protease
MTVQVARRLPWQPEATRLAMRGRLVVRIAEGAASEHVPEHVDVRTGARSLAFHLDRGTIDRTIARFSTAMAVTRAFHAAANLRRPGRRHEGWNDLERSSGLSRTYRIAVDPDTSLLALVSALRDLAAVETVSPHYLCETPFAQVIRRAAPHRSWAHEMIGARRALEREPGDSALIVAVIDSGVDLAHPELHGRLRPGVETADLDGEQVSRSVRLHAQPPDGVADQVGHGTSTAAIIGARGVEIPCGIAGRSPVLPVKVLLAATLADRSVPTAVGSLPDIDAGLKTAIDLGARVLNLSFGTPESALRDDDPRPHEDMVRYALARDCVLVAACGNSGDGTRYFPAVLPGVIAVGAVDEHRRLTSFTTRVDEVALCAPGDRIPVATLGGYVEASGTSFAAPFVAGAAALVIAHGARSGVPLPAALVRDLLIRSASPFATGSDSRRAGAGILDVPAALAATDEELGIISQSARTRSA